MKQTTTIVQLVFLPILSVIALVVGVVMIVKEAFESGMNYQFPEYGAGPFIVLLVSVGLAVWWICIVVHVARKRRLAKKTATLAQESQQTQEPAPDFPRSTSVRTAVKHGFWSTVIIVGLGLVLALAAAHAPKLEGNVTNLSFNRFSSAPTPTIQMDRPPDTPERFWTRFALGGVIGLMLGFAFHGTIIRKFEEDFTFR